MKKMILDYINIIGYTVTGLLFGLAFFLLFINFYHYQEINYIADVSEFNATNKALVQSKVKTIKDNIGVYSQSTYNGNYNIYGLNGAQIKLQECITHIESEEMMSYFDKEKINLKDSYNFAISFKNEILNDCLVMQAKNIFYTDTISSFPYVDVLRPYVDLNVESIIDSVGYVQDNIENADHFYFSTNSNKINFFSLVDDSYFDLVNRYQLSLDLLVEISNWYKTVVIGG